LGEGGKLSKQEKEQYRLEADRVLQDGEFWRKVGEEFGNPLIVTGRLGFEEQNRSGFQSEERVVHTPAGRPVITRGSRYAERKGFSLSADFYFLDGRTGKILHKEKFTEEVLYGEEQKVSPLSSYFELMDRLLPNFLGVITPQKYKTTRSSHGRTMHARRLSSPASDPPGCGPGLWQPARAQFIPTSAEQGHLREPDLEGLQSPHFEIYYYPGSSSTWPDVVLRRALIRSCL
jgi:hypothetical protein